MMVRKKEGEEKGKRNAGEWRSSGIKGRGEGEQKRMVVIGVR